jgi:acetyltransferase-like isoleucine patch superfamily enzyme
VGKNFSVRSDLTETTLHIGEEFQCRDNLHILLGHGGKLAIGQHCFFNNNCSITCLGSVLVGNNCQFGENVVMYDHNHNYKDSASLISEQGYTIGKIIIGNNCWVGSGVIILKDVVIGDNVVIGAGCVIRQSVPAGSVVYNQQQIVVNSSLH